MHCLAAALVLTAGALAAAARSERAPEGAVVPRVGGPLTGAQLTLELLGGVAEQGLAELYTFYNQSSGFFGPTEAPGPAFWTTANALETLANLYILLNGTAAAKSILPYVEHTFLTSKPRYCNCYRDDQQWYVLAWLRMFEATGNATYLQQAEDIFAGGLGAPRALRGLRGALCMRIAT
jgi:hypothetical protein